MGTITTNLELFKYDTVADKDEKFNITTALNDNFDKIDTAIGNIDTSPATTIKNGETVENLVNVNMLSETEFEALETINTNELNLVEYVFTPLDYYTPTSVAANTESTFSKHGKFFTNSTSVATIVLEFSTGSTVTLYTNSLDIKKGQKITSTVAGNFYAYEGQ